MKKQGNQIWDLISGAIPSHYNVNSNFTNKILKNVSEFLVSATNGKETALFIVSFFSNGNIEVRDLARRFAK